MSNKVYFGLFKEPDFKFDMFDIDMDMDTSSSQANFVNDTSMTDGQASSSMSMKKKKVKKDTSQAKKARNDPNAPPLSRIPLPELRDAEQYEKMRARKEATLALKLGETLTSYSARFYLTEPFFLSSPRNFTFNLLVFIAKRTVYNRCKCYLCRSFQ